MSNSYLMIKSILFVALGGSAGSVARYLISVYVQRYSWISFPLGTFLVNVLGCLLIGFLYGVFQKGTVMSNEMRLLLTVGFCGGFTTFSTFANEGFTLLRGGEFVQFGVYTILSVVVGIIAVYLGYISSNLIR
ncbi:MAG TPA: fluoride efflux transporter CrcB [Tenuifilaceae bacterium]|nr:fluoride efflux transporter CrcB [Tenuifilaceae bacterium]HPJ45519.1 fluoride efflux transporter CrcB [Tenuifilaceae bacterium]HPQ33827.1 fluoride efflux transporter CrcB [Tenuifilaceae bacterium]HRX68196.1 fluoride efflux transporter CrcB [Tenuifilaceae bacterium]